MSKQSMYNHQIEVQSFLKPREVLLLEVVSKPLNHDFKFFTYYLLGYLFELSDLGQLSAFA
jgi:hypothetical protein